MKRSAASLALAAFGLAVPIWGQQNSGVAHPPADDAIVTQGNQEDQEAAAPQKPVEPGPARSKPSPGVPAQAAAAAPANDYGAITETTDRLNTQRTEAAPPSRGVKLVPRPENPDYGVVGVVPSPSNELAEGTDIKVRLVEALSTDRAHTGEEFRGQVVSDVYKEGRIVIPVGSELRGRVVGVEQGHRLRNHATLRLRPDAVILPDGTAYHLYAQAVSSSEPGTRTDAEGGIQPKAHVAKDLAEFGGVAGGGAIVGAVLGGPVGAGAGAIVGAGVVTTHLLLQKPQTAKVEQGTEVVFSLTEPMDLLPTRN